MLVDERSGNLLAGMLMFGLWTAMKRNCAGWREQNRWVSVFSDELAVQAATSAEPIAWMRDQGRSYGVRLRLATQRAEQLPQAVRDVFLTFPNLISFRQESVRRRSRSRKRQPGRGRCSPPTTSATWPRSPRSPGSTWTAAWCRRSCVAVHNFEADPEATVSMLGYHPAAVTGRHAPPSRLTPPPPAGRTPGDPDVPAAAGPAARGRHAPARRIRVVGVRRRRRGRAVSRAGGVHRPVSRVATRAACRPPDHQPAVSWPAASIRSRCPHPEVTCPARLDPFWDGLWGRSSNLAWMTPATIDAQQRAGLVKLPHTICRDPDPRTPCVR